MAPYLHTARKKRHYTAVFSNTARANELGKTHDWVVLFCDNGDTEDRFTVITSEFGPLQRERIVASQRSGIREILFADGKVRSARRHLVPPAEKREGHADRIDKSVSQNAGPEIPPRDHVSRSQDQAGHP